jgi:SAM-dependent methyltransferase
MSRYYPAEYFTHNRVGTEHKKRFKHQIRNWILQRYYGYPGRSGAKPLKPLGRLLAFPIYLLFKYDRRNSLVIPFQGEGRFLDVGRLVSELGLRVHAGEIEDSPFEPGTFDVIHMSHVLEHLRDPKGSLERAFQLLKKGGRLYLRLPDGGSYCAQRFGRQWLALEVPRHLCTYTKETVRLLLEQIGFVVEYAKQDRSFQGLRKTLQSLDEKPDVFLTLMMNVKPFMQAIENLILLLGKGDAMIVCSRKP